MESLLRLCEARKPSDCVLTPDERLEVETILNRWLYACGASTDRQYFVRVRCPSDEREPIRVKRIATESWLVDCYSVWVGTSAASFRLEVTCQEDQGLEFEAMIDGADLLRQNPMDEESPTFKRMASLHKIFIGGTLVDEHLTDELALETGFCNARMLKAGLEFLASRGVYVVKDVCDCVLRWYTWTDTFNNRLAALKAKQEESAKPEPVPTEPEPPAYEKTREKLRKMKADLPVLKANFEAARLVIAREREEITALESQLVQKKAVLEKLLGDNDRDAHTISDHLIEIPHLEDELAAKDERVKAEVIALKKQIRAKARELGVPVACLVDPLRK